MYVCMCNDHVEENSAGRVLTLVLHTCIREMHFGSKSRWLVFLCHLLAMSHADLNTGMFKW